MRALLVVCCILGTIVPFYFGFPFFIEHGLNISLLIEQLFANSISSFFAADFLISWAVFMAWSFQDAKSNHISGWWQIAVANCCVGLSLALPLYLLKKFQHSK